MRAISTVVDATLFLLVLGLAVATIVGVPMVTESQGVAAEPTDHADAVAEHLATGTERVNYSLGPAARRLPGDPPIPIDPGPPFERSAHGTLASLLADAAVGTVTVDGEPIAVDGHSYERAVINATEERLHAGNYSVSVRTIWEPYPDAPLRGSVHAGHRPPATVDVTAATITVDAPIPASRQTAIAAARSDGFEGVADAVAEATVSGLFPPNKTVLALRSDYPVAELVAYRYDHASRAFGGKGGIPNGHTAIAAENGVMADALSDRIETDLRAQYASPEAAARNVSTGTVTVTVRAWSR